MKLYENKKGLTTTYVLVFGLIFLIILGGLFGFILFQLKSSQQRVAWNEAFQIGEAGLNYWRWCLNNNIESKCQTEKEYKDPTGKPIGKFSIEIIPKVYCGETTTRTIVSTGWTYDFPDIKRKLRANYARESVAKYVYLLNDNVWAGSDREIYGLYHSNGGIRMDGKNYSLVTSVQTEWVLTSSFGYPPCPDTCRMVGSQCICPGVFTTANGNPDLFSFPVPAFDFGKITIDLAKIKDLTDEYPQQKYWPPVTNLNPNGKGYHLRFRVLDGMGKYEVWIITELNPVLAYSLEKGWYWEYSLIANEYLYGTYNIDPDCPLIFFEDNLWLEGEVKGKVTTVSANLIDPNKDADVWLPGNIDYSTLDGSDGLTVVGERNVLIGPDSPNVMTLRGIYIAQKGHFGRNHYTGTAPTKKGELLTIYGSVVSNKRVGTAWLNQAGQVVSGYLNRENYIDPNLIYDPPPFTPYVSSDFRLLGWQEIR